MEINRLAVLAFYTACGLLACALIVLPMVERARASLETVAATLSHHDKESGK